MAQRFVFTELGQGLRRNLSMHIAVVLTLLVSLTLVGIGILLHQEAGLTQKRFGSELQITLNLCNGGTTDPSGSGCDGPVTDDQKSTIEATLAKLTSGGLVSDYHQETQEQAYAKLNQYGLGTISKTATTGPDPLITAKDLWSSYVITLGDSHKGDEVAQAIQHLPGVAFLQDNRSFVSKILNTIDRLQRGGAIAAVALVIAALLLVSNTIRLAAFARRREIAIMRLVGASTMYIALPFLLEGLVVAVVGAALSIGALAAVMWFGVVHGLSGLSWDTWVGWHDWAEASVLVAILGIVLTLLPTLLLTRKYLKV
jgi:cell division transport system permease protein